MPTQFYNRMSLEEIRNLPTSVAINKARVHESILRSFHIVEKIIELCEKETPHKVIIEIIDDLRNAPKKDHEIE